MWVRKSTSGEPSLLLIQGSGGSVFNDDTGDDGFSIRVEQRGQTTAIASCHKEVIHSGYRINNDSGFLDKAF